MVLLGECPAGERILSRYRLFRRIRTDDCGIFRGTSPPPLAGDVVRMAERPNSARESTNLIAARHTSLKEWNMGPPFAKFPHDQKEFALFPHTKYPPPKIGGGGYTPNSRFRIIPTLRLQPPTIPTDVVRDFPEEKAPAHR